MALEREIEILIQTKTYMNDMAGFGLAHIDALDRDFKEALEKHIENLKHMGFIQLAEMMVYLIDIKDIKTYMKIEFLLRALEEQILKSNK